MSKSIDHLKALALILLPLSLIKAVDRNETYFQIFYIVLGGWSFFKYQLWKNQFIHIIGGLFTINALAAFVTSDKIQYLEYLQLGSLISLIWLLRDKFTEYDFIKYSKFVTVLSIFGCAYYAFISKNIYGYRAYFGIERVAGIIGEPNFSGYAAIFPFCIFLKTKNIKWLFISIIPILWTQSRAIIVTILAVTSIYLIKKYSKVMADKLKLATIFLFALSPLIISGMYELSSDQVRSKLIHSLSTRFYLSRYYTELGIRSPVGVGLANGRTHYLEEGTDFRKAVLKVINDNTIDNHNKHTYVETAEQHSIFLQIVSEFGFLTYLMLFIFAIRYFRFLERLSFMTIGLVIPLSFMNGLNELTTFIFISYELLMISQIRDGKIVFTSK